MRRILTPVLLLLAIAPLFSCGPSSSARGKPKLVILLVVDQMRPDFLDRFGSYFTGGFRRLIDNGLYFDSTTHDHTNTETGPGHATIITGRVPAHHGIVSNSWLDRTTGKEMYCVEDADVRNFGDTTKEGISPRNMLTDALGDWIKRASPKSEVYALAVKDRTAAALGGKRPNAAIWWNRISGNFTSSTYYGDSLPIWVAEFNAERRLDTLKNREWTRAFPDSCYTVSTADDFPGETTNARFTNTFPHQLPWDSTRPEQFYKTYLYNSPFVDHDVLQLAEKLIDTRNLGSDASTDLVCIGISQTDMIGHSWGPNSQEIEDCYLRLDQKLGEFFSFLDRRIGAENYLIALSSDHGVLPLPEYLQSVGVASERITQDTVSRDFARIKGDLMKQGVADTSWIKGWIGEIYLMPGTIDEARRQFIITHLRNELQALPYVSATYERSELQNSGTPTDEFARYCTNSVCADRSPDIFVRCKENYLIGVGPHGTTHGSPYWYDRHVPLFFLGVGAAREVDHRQVHTIDIAPTIASMLGVEWPADVDGIPLLSTASR